jgi:hypothetical protein
VVRICLTIGISVLSRCIDPADGCGDGCNFPQFAATKKAVIDFRPACDEHDRCYASYGGERGESNYTAHFEMCNQGLLEDMSAACREAFPNVWSGDYVLCATEAMGYYEAVALKGMPSFNYDQGCAKKERDCGQIYQNIIGGGPAMDPLKLDSTSCSFNCTNVKNPPSRGNCADAVSSCIDPTPYACCLEGRCHCSSLPCDQMPLFNGC